MNSLKKTILVIIVSCLLFSFSNCGVNKDGVKIDVQDNPPFTITEASFQKWVAGIREGGSGIDVYVNITNISKEVALQDLFFRNKKIQLNASPTVPYQYVARFKHEGIDIIMDIDPEKEAENVPPEKFPFQLNDTEAVISYIYKGNTEYYKIKELEEKEMLAYPSGNPNDEN